MTPEDFVLKYEAALATQDWIQVAPLIHENACVTFSNGSVHRGKTAVEKAFRKNFSSIQNESYRMTNIHWVQKRDSLAVYLFEFQWSGVMQGQSIRGAGKGTCVITKLSDDWRLLVEHLGPNS